MIRHVCGYNLEILCKNCRKPLAYNPRQGLYCPFCGHEVTLVCPGCGKKW